MPKLKKGKAPKTVRTMLSIQAIPDVSGITTAELYGQEHTVIPCIAIVEGVLWPANAPGPELALAEEFGRFPQGWNGRPVTFGHPTVNGNPVSASTPGVLEVNAFGQLFNTTLEGKKLKTEIWINNARIDELGEEAQEAIESLKSGEGVAEVSTGLFTMSEAVEGTFDGEDYQSIWRNIVPDHLAVLPDGIVGACSVEDGCGAPRANQMHPVMRAAQLNTDAGGDDEDEQQGLFKRILEVAGGILGFTNAEEHLSDGDLRTALHMALKGLDADSWFFILAVYPGVSDAGTFVYEVGFDGTLFERSFSIEQGAIAISAEPTAVRPVTTFVPVVVTTNQNQEKTMNVEELVNALIANEGTQFTEDNREWLSTLEEDLLSQMSPAPSPEPSAEELAAAEALRDNANGDGNDDGDDAPVNTEDYIAAAPPAIQSLLNAGIKLHNARKNALVTALVGNARCKFTEAQLNSKEVEELENMAALAQDITYEGQGTVLTAAQGGGDDLPPPAPLVFEVPKADAN